MIRVGVGKRQRCDGCTKGSLCARSCILKTRVEGEDVNVSMQKLVVLEDVEMEGGWKLYRGGGGSFCEN